jgi:hypothetical protein
MASITRALLLLDLWRLLKPLHKGRVGGRVDLWIIMGLRMYEMCMRLAATPLLLIMYRMYMRLAATALLLRMRESVGRMVKVCLWLRMWLRM